MTGSKTSRNRGILDQRKTSALCILFLTLSTCAPAPIAVSVKPDSGLTRTGTWKVVADHGDPVRVKEQLERLLVAKGFLLVKTPEEKTDYLLRFQYVFLTGFRNFSAIVVHTGNNEVVAIGKFEGYRIDGGFLEEFVTKMADQVR